MSHQQYPDSITITNAGGFPSGVDMNNILTVNSVPHSKLMSEILQKTGLVERSGQGVDKMFLQLYYCDVLSCVCDCFTDYYKKKVII